MSVLGVYRPGRSVVHRTTAGWKLLLLVALGGGSVFVDEPWMVAAGAALVGLGYVAAGIGPRATTRQVRPLLWVLLVVASFHAVVSGWERAVVVTGVIALLVLSAGLVTLTTPTQDLLEVIVRVLGPLRRVGVDPERVGLLLALSLRSVPVVIGLAEEVRDAQRARGLGASPRAFAVPLVIRALRHADDLGEALVARGVDD